MRAKILWLALLLGLAPLLRAQLVTPPSVDWVSIPSTATVGQSVSVGVGAHANASDNSDGNDWNAGTYLTVARIMVDLNRPGESNWTRIYEWLSPWHSPAEIWTSFTVTSPGTHTIHIQVMDGRPWYSGDYYYNVYAPNPAPSITSGLNVYYNQNQYVSYQITATNSPTSFSASGLPPGVSLNTSTGVISGYIPSGGTWNSTIYATNGSGTGSATLTWNVTAASMWASASVSPSTVYNGGVVTLTRDGWANFGIMKIQNSMFPPSGPGIDLGDTQTGSMSWSPTQGPGTYWYRIRVVDIYSNYTESWYSFTVTQPAVSAPTSVSATTTGTTFVNLSWSGASAQAGIQKYNVYRNGSYIGSTTGTTWSDTGLNALTGYSYVIYTVDNQNNVSAASATLNVTTARDLVVFSPAP